MTHVDSNSLFLGNPIGSERPRPVLPEPTQFLFKRLCMIVMYRTGRMRYSLRCVNRKNLRRNEGSGGSSHREVRRNTKSELDNTTGEDSRLYGVVETKKICEIWNRLWIVAKRPQSG